MEWTTPADLREQVRRLFDKGRLLAGMVAESEPLFPLRLALRKPSSGDLSDRFADVRAWVRELQQGQSAGYRLVLREVRHRVLGANAWPDEAWVDSLDDALRLAGKRREALAFERVLAETRERQPALLPWLQANPLRALEAAGDWARLLDVIGWLKAHPRPGIYLRQVDLGGVHSKFIEEQRALLSSLLDAALPAPAIDTAASGTVAFAQRYGFRDKPVRIRLRLLDPALRWFAGPAHDVTVTADAFAALDVPASSVFITENEINFLSFPCVEGGIVIFGSGYGFEQLARARWLRERAIHYWGDIDTHGFAILDQLRTHLPHAQSLLMDRATLFEHRPLWTDEPRPFLRDLANLNAAERALFDDLRWQRIEDRRAVRLEQERIAFGRVEAALEALVAARDARAAAPY